MSKENMSNISVCASCGIAEVDEVKLKECTDCDLVRYCCEECQRDHRSQHEQACKKRAAELRDEFLFRQPESSHLGDCPICMIPMPLDPKKSTNHNCCSKLICNGCSHANNMIREVKASLDSECPFCREPLPTSDEGCDKQRMKRVEANDPVAIRREGRVQYDKGDYRSAVELYTKAAELGDVAAHYSLSCIYRDGLGVEKDKEQKIHHLEVAAIGGHPTARYILAIEVGNNGNIERAVKHFIIAANQGHDNSIKPLMAAYRSGMISNEVLAAALRAHQAAVDATKTPQRDAAEEYY